MLNFDRPNENDSFEGRVTTKRQDVEDAINNNLKPEFPSTWRDFKADFASAQQGRCGYCEIQVIAGQFGNVEHYAPKGAVNEIATPGEEQLNLSNVKGRTFNTLSDRGYWWLAYDWGNYLLACEICNQQWKEACFPIADNN